MYDTITPYQTSPFFYHVYVINLDMGNLSHRNHGLLYIKKEDLIKDCMEASKLENHIDNVT